MSTLTTFEAHGHTWQVHTPGDPMPCKPDTLIFTLFKCEFEKGIIEVPASNPDKWKWQEIDDDYSIIGWRYAAPPQEKDELTRLREENARLIEQRDAAREDARRLAALVEKWREELEESCGGRGRIAELGIELDLAAHEALTAKDQPATLQA